MSELGLNCESLSVLIVVRGHVWTHVGCEVSAYCPGTGKQQKLSNFVLAVFVLNFLLCLVHFCLFLDFTEGNWGPSV